MFIVIDGPDGNGKSTAAAMLHEKLSRRHDTLLTREPTGGAAGKRIRSILASGEGQEDLTSLFIRDRTEHLRDCILPALAAGQWVISDRYLYSTICYQSLRGEDIRDLIQLHEGFLRPDAAFLLLPPSVELLLERIGRRGEQRELFEREETLRQVMERYRALPALMPEEAFTVLDCALSPEALTEAMLAALPSHGTQFRNSFYGAKIHALQNRVLRVE